MDHRSQRIALVRILQVGIEEKHFTVYWGMSIAQARTTLRGARPLWSHWDVETSGMYTKRSSSETRDL